jgi:hypothetical protein
MSTQREVLTTYTLTQAQYDELHGTFANRDILRILKSLQPNPAPISKEDMVKVLEALQQAGIPAHLDVSAKGKANYSVLREAITIMQSAIEGMK